MNDNKRRWQGTTTIQQTNNGLRLIDRSSIAKMAKQLFFERQRWSYSVPHTYILSPETGNTKKGHYILQQVLFCSWQWNSKESHSFIEQVQNRVYSGRTASRGGSRSNWNINLSIANISRLARHRELFNHYVFSLSDCHLTASLKLSVDIVPHSDSLRIILGSSSINPLHSPIKNRN